MKNRSILVFSLILVIKLPVPVTAGGQAHEVFQDGKKDQSFTEFARERKPGHPVVYRAGQSSAATDWPAYQPGTFDYQVGRSTMEKDWVSLNPGLSAHLANDPAPVPFQVVFPFPHRQEEGSFFILMPSFDIGVLPRRAMRLKSTENQEAIN